MSGEDKAATPDTGVNIAKERIFPVVFMLLVTAFFIAGVSGIYLATRDNVLRNEQLYLKRAVLFAAGIEIPESAEQIENLYLERVKKQERIGESGEAEGVARIEADALLHRLAHLLRVPGLDRGEQHLVRRLLLGTCLDASRERQHEGAAHQARSSRSGSDLRHVDLPIPTTAR